jgi:hypothetical protein
MNTLLRPLAIISVFLSFGINAQSLKENKRPKIQVAILLDVSNSMDGLIEQAKSQLWNMVKILGRVRCDNENPEIEVALFEYGRSTNSGYEGYVKHIAGFTKDLDQLGIELNSLTTNGGDEYCGYVMNTSLEKLNWDTSTASYKVIFIAGNESFLQGNISYTIACNKAREKGIIVNTIYCGDWKQGLAEHWNLGAECGNGSFTIINQDAKQEFIPSPYDSALYLLNNQFNDTYVYYGNAGKPRSKKMMQMDTVAHADPNDINKILNYVIVKSNRQLRNDESWDLASVYEKDSTGKLEFDKKTLPDSLQNKTDEQIQQIVSKKALERIRVRKEIDSLSKLRDLYIATEEIKRNKNTEQTLETEIEKIIRQQIIRYRMKIE